VALAAEQVRLREVDEHTAREAQLVAIAGVVAVEAPPVLRVVLEDDVGVLVLSSRRTGLTVMSLCSPSRGRSLRRTAARGLDLLRGGMTGGPRGRLGVGGAACPLASWSPAATAVPTAAATATTAIQPGRSNASGESAA